MVGEYPMRHLKSNFPKITKTPAFFPRMAKPLAGEDVAGRARSAREATDGGD
jgi:hypothetical protein